MTGTVVIEKVTEECQFRCSSILIVSITIWSVLTSSKKSVFHSEVVGSSLL